MPAPRAPIEELATHRVENQPPPLGDLDLFATDPGLAAGVRLHAAQHEARIAEFARAAGREEARELSVLADTFPPRLRNFDRYGRRIDEVEFHPAYHQLMRLGLEGGVSSAAWTAGEGGHVLHAALIYLMGQVDPGVTCPMSMTYAAVPALRHEPAVAAEWEPRIRSGRYDPAFVPAAEKAGVTLGMAMTEKQGGSDVRANTTRAEADGEGYRLFGHKWFCSAPMSDAFLTLAWLDGALSCFLVPRWTPDGRRNAIQVMRLKDKMGDRSNASSEIEYHGAFALPVGRPGRGVRTIIEMVQHTRLDCVAGSASGMRAALVEAIWHARHRSAFQKRLADQPAMAAVLADLALESEAATALMLRLAAAFDRAAGDPREAAFARLATPVAKYWVCKRQPGHVGEALECLGGAGYVEEGPMPKLFRQSPLNAIWEGSGNVIALDVLRAIGRERESLEAVMAELAGVRGLHPAADRHLDRLERWFRPGALHEGTARALAGEMALALQFAALAGSAPGFVVEAFAASRLEPEARAPLYGASPGLGEPGRLVERALAP